MVWRDNTLNGPWNTVAAQATPDGSGAWYNTIPSSNYCHTYTVYANYAGTTSATYTYTGLGSGYCSETASITWLQTSYALGTSPPNSLCAQGTSSSSNAPAGLTLTMWLQDTTMGTPWTQGSTTNFFTGSSGTWYVCTPNVTYSHQYNVYAAFDAYNTATCTYSGDGVGGTCP